MIKSATAYLFFDGNASTAVKHYEQALGAKVDGLMRYADVPRDAGSPPPAAENRDRVIHALLHVGEARVMLSDVPADQKGAGTGNVYVSLEFDDPKETVRSFEALASGGQVVMGLHDAFWGATFGMVIDRFGVGWMFTGPKRQASADA